MRPSHWAGTQDGELCGVTGTLSAAQFEAAMRHQLRLFAGRRLSDYLAHSCSAEAERAPVCLTILFPQNHTFLSIKLPFLEILGFSSYWLGSTFACT